MVAPPQELSRIILCMETGQQLILKDHERVYGSLYDMLNQSYTTARVPLPTAAGGARRPGTLWVNPVYFFISSTLLLHRLLRADCEVS